MNAVIFAVLKDHFEKWSGGFSPDSTERITVYLDYARPRTIDREEARSALVAWMEREAAGHVDPN